MAIGSTIKLSLDSREVQRGISDMQSKFQNFAHAVEAFGLAEIGKHMVEGLLEAAKSIGEMVLKITEMGEGARASERRLLQMATNTGLFGDKVGEVSERLDTYAETMGRNIGVDHEAIMLTQSKLLTFKNLAMWADVTGGAFDRATKACYDLAANGMGTAETAAIRLGKMLQDPLDNLNALSRAGIKFSEAEKDKLKALQDTNDVFGMQEFVLDKIEKKVGGAADAAATASGKLIEMKKQVEDAFAKPFSEGFDALPGKMEGMLDELKKIAGTWGKVLGNAIADAVNGNYDKFEQIGETVGKAIEVGVKTLLEKIGVDIISWAGHHPVISSLLGGPLVSGAAQYAVSTGPAPTAKQLWNMNAEQAGLQQSYQNTLGGRQGIVPGTNGGWTYGADGSSPFRDSEGNTILRTQSGILEDIKKATEATEKNTEGGAKM